MQRERRQTGEHQAQLQVARSQHAAEAIEPGHFRDTAHAMPADRLLDRIDAEEQGAVAAAGQCLQQRICGPHADNQGQAAERDATSTRGGDRRRGQPQERQIAQVDRGLAQRARAVGRIQRRQRFRSPVGEEQHAGQCPRRSAQQLAAAAEPGQQQLDDGRQRAQHHDRLGIAGRRPQRDEHQHPCRRPAPTGVGASARSMSSA